MKNDVLIRDNGSRRVSIVFESQSLTEQSHKNECDVNLILKRYPNALLDNSSSGKFVDLTGIEDYQANLNAIIEAQSSFESLPAKIRKRFDNDPAMLLSFIDDEANYDEAVKLGLIASKPVQLDIEDAIAAAASDVSTEPL